MTTTDGGTNLPVGGARGTAAWGSIWRTFDARATNAFLPVVAYFEPS